MLPSGGIGYAPCGIHQLNTPDDQGMSDLRKYKVICYVRLNWQP
jgi:hypothetical protein